IETYEVEIERMRSESITRESEKRRLAEIVKSLGDGRAVVGSEAGAREGRVSLPTIHLPLLLPFWFYLDFCVLSSRPYSLFYIPIHTRNRSNVLMLTFYYHRTCGKICLTPRQRHGNKQRNRTGNSETKSFG